MKPTPAAMLQGCGAALLTRIAPQLEEGSYLRGEVTTLALMMMLLAQEADRTVERLVNENAAMRALFAEAAQAPFSEELKERLAAAAAGQDTSLRVSALEESNVALRITLQRLDQAVDRAPWAADWKRRILDLMLQSAKAGAFDLPAL